MPNIFLFLGLVARILVILIIFFVSCLPPVVSANPSLKVALANYKPYRFYKDIEVKVMEKNVEKYTALIEKASNEGAHIVVFPEYGLTTDECLTSYFPHVYSINLEDHLNKTICMNQMDVDITLIRLSCKAISNKIHIVVSLIEKKQNDETIFFSTIIINDKGVLTEIYRKRTLTDKHHKFQSGNEEMAVVVNELGRFGILSGFDPFLINSETFKEHDVDKIILTSSIQSQYPFIHGPSLYSAYSKNNDVTVIVSSLGTRKYKGSGVYDRNSSRVFYNDILITATIPLSTEKNTRRRRKRSTTLTNIQYDFTNYQSCLHDLDSHTENCHIAVIFNDNIEKLSYKKATCLNKNLLQNFTDTSVCALVYCPDDVCSTPFPQSINIKKIEIDMTLTKGKTVIQSLPITLKANNEPVDNFEFLKKDNNFFLHSNGEENKIITFGILMTVKNETEVDNLIETTSAKFSSENKNPDGTSLDKKNGAVSKFSSSKVQIVVFLVLCNFFVFDTFSKMLNVAENNFYLSFFFLSYLRYIFEDTRAGDFPSSELNFVTIISRQCSSSIK